jgi:hypothetical protein
MLHVQSVGEDELFGYFGDHIAAWDGHFGRLAREEYFQRGYAVGPIYADYALSQWIRWRSTRLSGFRSQIGLAAPTMTAATRSSP